MQRQHIVYSMSSNMFLDPRYPATCMLDELKVSQAETLHDFDVTEVFSRFTNPLLVLDGGEDVDPSVYGDIKLPHCGGTSRLRDAWEIKLYSAAVEMGIPVLGICRGSQLLCALNGGKLHQDIHVERGRAHSREHNIVFTPEATNSGLIELMESCPLGVNRVNSFHHQGVKSLPDRAIILAHAHDGLPEAVLYPGKAFGVQWHPEYIGHREFLDWARDIIGV